MLKSPIFSALLILAILIFGCRNDEFLEEDFEKEEEESYESDTATTDTTAIDSTLIDSTLIDSTLIDSTLIDSTLIDSTLIDSTLIDSTLIEDPIDSTMWETYPDWTESTHSNSVSPNVSLVFAEGVLNRIDITISASDWDDMWDDLDDNLSSSSSGGNFPGGNFGGGGGNMGGGDISTVDFDPIWAPCTFTFNDTDWYQVGIRFKGNSSLSSAYSSGNEKLSFKLDFDEYEDDYPELKNQRFYGFKQLNLNSNYNDDSMMRDKVAADLFREFGLAAAHATFCTVYIDYGSGPEYFGVYTMIEEVDDSVIDTQFASGDGNLYKPEDDAAQFKSGSYDEDEFYLKTNEKTCDYSDVLALYNAINSSTRTSNSTAWQAQLESVFDVDTFLKWLAVNAVIQNWDQYGVMAHNYFLYNNPSNGLLTWIPWDYNEAFKTGNTSIEVSKMGNVSSSWPLISYLYDVPAYEATYKSYLRQFVDEVFIVSDMQALYTTYYSLLKQAAYDEVSGRSYLSSDYSFDSAVSTLKTHVQTRNTVVNNYVQ